MNRITLDMSNVFKHRVELRDDKNRLLESIEAIPSDSIGLFKRATTKLIGSDEIEHSFYAQAFELFQPKKITSYERKHKMEMRV